MQHILHLSPQIKNILEKLNNISTIHFAHYKNNNININ